MIDSAFPVPPLEAFPQLAALRSAGGPDLSLSSLVYATNSYEVAASYAAFFWPKFIEVDGCILNEDRYSPDNLASWIENLNGDLSRVESGINHVHFYDLVGDDSLNDAQTLALCEYLAKVAMRTWRAALAEQFPGRTFEFLLTTEPDDYGPTMYFWQVRAPSSGASP